MVQMSYWTLCMGGWVGGWMAQEDGLTRVNMRLNMDDRARKEVSRWVGGWVDRE